MSEAERKKRQDYKENRKKWIIIQAIAIALISIIALSSFVVFDRVNREYYIEYSEEGNIDYEVFLNENEFFEGDSVGEDRAYISSLINNINASLKHTGGSPDASGSARTPPRTRWSASRSFPLKRRAWYHRP